MSTNICPVHGVSIKKNIVNSPKWVALLSKEYNEYYYVNCKTGETVWTLPLDVQPSEVGTAAQFKINPSFKEDILCTCDQLYIIEKTDDEIKMDTNGTSKQLKDDSGIRHVHSARVRKKKGISRRQSLPSNMDSVAENDKVNNKETNRKLEEDDKKVMMDLQIKNILVNGGVFLKHGTHRKPHWKFVFLNESDEIEWVDLKSKMKKAKKSNKKSIKIIDIIQILEGKRTPVLKHKRCQKVESDLCFSVICPERSLDLQAPTSSTRDTWVNTLASYIEKLQPSKQQLPIHPDSTPPQQIDQLHINHKKFLRAVDENDRDGRIGFRSRESRVGPNRAQTSRIPRSKSLVRKNVRKLQ